MYSVLVSRFRRSGLKAIWRRLDIVRQGLSKEWGGDLGHGTENRSLVYLDQNKWIQLARVLNGKEESEEIARIPGLVQSDQIVMPLSQVHYMESSRIKDPLRRERLGRILWDISAGKTLASIRAIKINEIELAISKFFPRVQVDKIEVLGRGVEHAFGIDIGTKFPPPYDEIFERSLVTGEMVNGERPSPFLKRNRQASFKKHLEGLQSIKSSLPRDRWVPALYAISWMDILDPFNMVLTRHGLSKNDLSEFDESTITAILDSMPSQKVDLHLHKQVLRNDAYIPKLTDLEDWAGLGFASMYCDVLVCEKHFQDLLSRDGFETRAKVITDLSALPALIDGN